MISREGLQLVDGLVLLRPYRPDDVARLHEAACESIDEVSPWMPWCHADYNIEESRWWVESRPDAWQGGTEYEFVICDAETSLYLGGCGLNHVDTANGNANLGYWVRTSRTGEGVATAATRLLVRFGFSRLGLNRIEIIAATGNGASQRVAEKAGATREGVLRNRLVIGDTVHDAVVFSFIPADMMSGE